MVPGTSAERWPSGRRRTPGKCVGGEPSQGFESLSLRQLHLSHWWELFLCVIMALDQRLLHAGATQGFEMARQPRLTSRNGVWQFRARVPAHLRAILGKTEVTKSLGRISRPEAERRVRELSHKLDEEFTKAEQQLRHPVAKRSIDDLSDSEIGDITRSYFLTLEASVDPVPFSASEREALEERYSEMAFLTAQTSDDAGLHEDAVEIAKSRLLEIGPSGSGLGRLVDGVQRALVEHYNRQIDRLTLRTADSLDPLFRGIDAATAAAPADVSLSEAVNLFLGAPDNSHWAARTRQSYRSKFALLEALIGPSTPVRSITRETMRQIQTTIVKLPRNALKLTKKGSLQRVANLAANDGRQPMSAKNAATYLQAANTLFQWLLREEKIVKNPGHGLTKGIVLQEPRRRGFTVAELNALFSSSHFSRGETPGGWLFWLPRIALFTGARFAEILALRKQDIQQVDGVHVLSIVPYEERGLKTKESRRLVPIHPTLINLGLLRLTQGAAAGLLFPDAAGPQDMLNARNKEIGRKLRKVLPDKDVVFHSFRHTFKDAASRARIAREHIAALGGWEIEGGRAAMDGYGRDPMVRLLFEEISKIQFKDLTLG